MQTAVASTARSVVSDDGFTSMFVDHAADEKLSQFSVPPTDGWIHQKQLHLHAPIGVEVRTGAQIRRRIAGSRARGGDVDAIDILAAQSAFGRDGINGDGIMGSGGKIVFQSRSLSRVGFRHTKAFRIAPRFDVHFVRVGNIESVQSVIRF